MGADFIKVYSMIPRDAYFAIADEAKRRNMVFAGHVPEFVSVATRDSSVVACEGGAISGEAHERLVPKPLPTTT